MRLRRLRNPAPCAPAPGYLPPNQPVPGFPIPDSDAPAKWRGAPASGQESPRRVFWWPTYGRGNSIVTTPLNIDRRGDNKASDLLKIILLSTYEMGRQPFGLSSPAAWLRADGHEVTCADLSRAPLPRAAVAEAGLVAFYLPMHTATRLALAVMDKAKLLNPHAHF